MKDEIIDIGIVNFIKTPKKEGKTQYVILNLCVSNRKEENGKVIYGIDQLQHFEKDLSLFDKLNSIKEDYIERNIISKELPIIPLKAEFDWQRTYNGNARMILTQLYDREGNNLLVCTE